MLINEIREEWNGRELEFKVEELKARTYYVVEIKFSKQNVKHRCMMGTGFNHSDGVTDCELFSRGYEAILRRKIKDIYWFKIIKEIPEMQDIY